MNILYILNEPVLTGPNIVALTNAERLYRQGCQVSICFIKVGTSLLHNNFAFLEEIEVTFLESAFLVGKLISLRRFVNKIKPDIVHSHCFFPDLLNAIIKVTHPHKLRKHLSTIHNIPMEDYPIRYGFLKGNILFFVHNIILSAFDMCVCISKTVQNSVKISPTYVIYNPVREVFFNKKKENMDTLTIAYCGHFSKLKNPMGIINVLSKIQTKFKFFGIGGGELLDKCKESVKDDSRFTFLGRVDNVSDYYKTVNCLIHFSQTEGFCLSVAEALSSELYVVANNLPVFIELREVLDADSLYILDDLSYESVDFVLNHILVRIGHKDNHVHNVAEKAQEKFSPEKTAMQHLLLYKKLL